MLKFRINYWIILSILVLNYLPRGFSQNSIFEPPVKNNCPRSQKQADIWCFGEHAGIDFRSGIPVPITDQDVMTAFKASSTISDSLGNLLFFTNGTTAWDRTFTVMPGADAMAGDAGVTQPCIIVPKPGNQRLYYIFNIDVLAFQSGGSYVTRGLTYTAIDMNLRNGLGRATDSVNVPILSPVTQKLTAVFHQNSEDIWVIVHKWDSYDFYAYLITEEGINPPVISSKGELHGGNVTEQTNAYGYMKVSPDGKQLALVITGKDMIQLFDFDHNTGIISNPRSHTFGIPGVNPYGLEFSPDGKMIYASLIQITGNGPPSRPSFVIQFDLNEGLVDPVIIDSIPGIRLGGMQLAVDGKIYISRTVNLISKKDSLDVIYNPTRPGLACNYNQLNLVPESRFSLDGRNSFYSLPNEVQSYFDIPVFTYDSCCYLNFTRFHITNQANIDEVIWDFGDGGTSADPEPVYFYTQPGTYWVKLTEVFQGESFTDSLPVEIHPLPGVELGDTILLYTGASINLHAGGGQQSYEWSTGSSDSVITVSSQGDYRVEVTDWNCCTNTDSVYLQVFEYYIPNAFTPNGDGLNDFFRVVGLYHYVNFKMYIYNRWGELVFESANIETGWDGTFNNQESPSDTYVWVVYVDFLGEDIITNGNVMFKGTVTLVR